MRIWKPMAVLGTERPWTTFLSQSMRIVGIGLELFGDGGHDRGLVLLVAVEAQAVDQAAQGGGERPRVRSGEAFLDGPALRPYLWNRPLSAARRANSCPPPDVA